MYYVSLCDTQMRDYYYYIYIVGGMDYWFGRQSLA